MGGGGVSGGRCGGALRLLLLVVMALAAVEFLFGSILEASPLRSYLYTPVAIVNATHPTNRTRQKSSDSWPKRLHFSPKHTIHPDSDIKNTNKSDAAKNITILSKLLNVKHDETTIETRKDSNVTGNPLMEIKGSPTTNATDSATEASERPIYITKSSTELPLCDEMPPYLGPIQANKTEVSLDWVETKYPQVSEGGMYRPLDCIARHKVAIIVAFRDRKQHLAIFLNHMHAFLMKQQLDYGMFIVEQLGNKEFNRAKLFNVGFVESQKARPGGWQCFVFHDVDLLPMDGRNMYSCPKQPRHMSAALDKHNYQLLYYDLFGGVSALTREQFVKVNGFPNKFWGWGGEDDEMARRIKKHNYHIARYKMSIARYTMLDHHKSPPNPKRFELLSQSNKEDSNKDGLTTLHYKVEATEKHHLYTLIRADIEEHS